MPLDLEKIRERIEAVRKEAEAKPTRKTFRSLKEYYLSPEWEGKRLAALHRARYRCESCGNPNPPLQAHHLTYAHLYNERPEDLRVLCLKCHPAADSGREQETAYDTYMSKKYGDDYEDTKAAGKSSRPGWKENKRAGERNMARGL